MDTFRSAVSSYWNIPPLRGDVIVDLAGFMVVVDGSLLPRRRVMQVVVAGGREHFALRPEVAEAAHVREASPGNPEALLTALAAAGEQFHGWDQAFYLGERERAAIVADAHPPHIRALTMEDAPAFAAFQAANSAEDLDEASVELDHWLVVGAVEPDGAGAERIVAVASVYPWDETMLADIGILTSPEARGRGLARELVRAAARDTIARGYEPQYRCGVENAASRATALAAGFTLYADYRVVTGDPPD